jgi:hypothetical protein
MTAIMGRMSAYAGKPVSWKWITKSSKLDLTPKEYKFGPNPVNPLPVPGNAKLA